VEADANVGIYPIHAVSEMTGIPATTLRHWEQSFRVIVPSRSEGGHRLYSQSDVQSLIWLKAKVDEGVQPGVAHHLLERELQKLGSIASEAEHRGVVMILVAERDPVTAELEEYFLRTEGYEVRTVLDGKTALEEAQTLLPDLIIVDIILPGLSGLKVCRALKADPATQHIPVLVFSVLDVRDRALDAGADAFLLKPLERPQLVKLVRDLVGHRYAERERL
jgi:CheY-like chemotaxis protein